MKFALDVVLCSTRTLVCFLQVYACQDTKALAFSRVPLSRITVLMWRSDRGKDAVVRFDLIGSDPLKLDSILT